MTDIAHPASTPRAPGLLATVDHYYSYFENFLAALAGLAVFALMLSGTAEVLSRRFLNFPLPGHIDLIELSMPIIAFLTAAYCQRLGGHIRMDLAIDALKNRPRWLAEALACGVALFVLALLIPGTWEHFLRAYQLGDTTMDAEFAVWPSKLMVPVGLSILFVRLLINLWGYLRMMGDPTREEVAIPKPPSIEEITEHAVHEVFDGNIPTQENNSNQGRS